ncbi:DUF4226 domain-containing protein [Mycolicibacter sp. MYC123]|uniref:DUF4226 domain-containing protein n=1 Tax=[Mycobacterium] zoologicum TaxID=2872311 RepID=A0ABU5YQ94_9MYCO|nr:MULTISPECIES: DUF4226 domain-containing protein [unclassified Mycolicibacter]MEB3052237.1 DUF4226 domain-containing protein [Mycolicibacter sp. MYC123]MEB3064162.1 DUF4226 domain-containing protein [Mycolicibacter sp. MYC101]
MTTRDDVLDVIHRIETAGNAGEATRAAQAALTLPLPSAGYDRVLDQLRTAYPRIVGAAATEQQGAAAQAMKEAEAELRQQLSATAEFDRHILEALRHAGQNTVEGRRRLDNLEAEIVGAARAWDLSTAAGSREFQRYLIGKLGEIIRVVAAADDDDTAKQELTTALTALYTDNTGRDESSPAAQPPAGVTDPVLMPDVPAKAGPDEEDPWLDPDLDDAYLDDELEPEPGPAAAAHYQPGMPSMPPNFGGESPGFGGMPAGMSPGLPLAGLGSDPFDDIGDQEYPRETEAEDAGPEDKADTDTAADADDAGGPAPEPPADDGPVTVRLPDGQTTSVADPQLAAAMQAAADGTPVAEAFRRQGIAIPPPGTPVTAPVDQAQLQPGDIGVFTDRHALAVGDGRALLDGQLHLAGNLRGPGFLGWQHPPIRAGGPAPVPEPVPTHTAGYRWA